MLRLTFVLVALAAPAVHVLDATPVRGTAPVHPAAPVHRTAPDAAVAPDAPNAPVQESDLDRFMQQVLARRDENWKKLQQYVLEEQERFQLTGPDASRLYGFDRDYTWFIREGYFIRSPLRVDGVKIGEAERAREEADWLKREQAREKRAAERAKERGENPDAASPDAAGAPVSVEDVLLLLLPVVVAAREDALHEGVEVGLGARLSGGLSGGRGQE